MLLKYRFEYFLFIVFGKLLSLFGFSFIKYTSKIIAFLAFFVFKVRKEIVVKNLSYAFPHLNINEINRLAYRNYISVSITFLEVFLLSCISKEKILSRFDFTGLELVKSKMEKNKGLILLTAHFGNWELGATAFGLYLNKRINVLAKVQHNPYVAKWIRQNREKYGNIEIPLGISIKEIFKSLRNNEIVGVVGDQRGPKNGVKVKYFNKETYTFAGTAAIALKTKSPVLVLLSVRNSKGYYKTKIEEIEINKFIGTNEEQIVQFNQKYMSILEKNVRQYPEQWFWLHNIWKY